MLVKVGMGILVLGPLAQTQLGGFVSKTVPFLQGTGDGEGMGVESAITWASWMSMCASCFLYHG